MPKGGGMTREIRQIAIFFKSYKMKARAGLSLPILTTVEVEIELHLWSVCQQILKRVKFQQKKDSLGWGSNSIAYGKGGYQIFIVGGGRIKGGDKPLKGGGQTASTMCPPFRPPEW